MTNSADNAPRRPPAGVLIAGGCALAAMLLGLFAPHDGAVWRMPHVLEQRVASALVAAGYPGLDIEMQGQRAVLRGMVEDESGIESARRAALTAAGPGGSWAGGVTSVDVSGVAIGAIQRPFQWGARRDDGRVILSGAVPSEITRQSLMGAARAAFPGADPVDEMQVAGGAASPAFARVARSAIRALARLETGEVRIIDSHVAFIGDATGEGARAIHALFAEPPPPFRVRYAFTIDGLDVQNPELQGLNLNSGDAETCERAFDRLMERNVINFPENSAAIDPSSRRILDALATVALRCDRFALEVAGHTDNVGAREANMTLSRARADAVANYLAAQGVSRSRLTARGYGPDSPRISNDTEAGRAANRRIEFYVGEVRP